MPIAQLERRFISLSGDGVDDFLLGLTTNNLKAPLSFQALLTPQGKIIADFFVTKAESGLLIDVAPKFASALYKRLKMYKLRAKIDLLDVTDRYLAYALWGGQGEEGHSDPRHSDLGRRLISRLPLEATASAQDYNAHRLSLCIPDSEWDFDTSERFPADMNMDLLSGVDYQKGCFVGQEVVSRMHRKGNVRKRSCGFDGQAKAGDSLWQRTDHGDAIVGEVLSCFEAPEMTVNGMAVIRIDKINFDVPVYLKSGDKLSVRPVLL